MKKLISLISCIVIVLVASLTLSACGKSDTNAKIVATNSEIELVLGTGQETKSVEFELKDYGNGSDQLNFSLEENEKDIVSISQTYKKNGKTVLTIKGLSRGTARIFVTSLQGSQKYILTVKVIQPITGLELKTEYANSLYAIAGKSLSLSQQEIWNFIPSNTNQRDLVFSFVGESQGCEIVDGKLVVSENCTLQSVLVQATSASNPDITTEFEVKILKPIQVVLQMDGKTVVENVSSSNEILNYLEIFPTEKDDSIYPNSKTVTLIVKAGSQNETLKIDKIFGTDLEKFSVLQTGYDYDSARKLHRFVFNIQGNSPDVGNVDNITFGVSYDGYNAGESNYVENSVVLNLNSYNKPSSVEVNGQNKSVEIDIFENSINMTNGQLIELTILPGNLKSGENYITIWAKDFENLPVSLYRLNATRTGYICVFGYDKNGHAVGNESGIIRYATIASGTKLYAFINNKYLSNTTNKSAEIYAQASTFCEFTATETSRALTKVTFTINPNAKNVFIADKTDSGMDVRQNETTIFAELGKSITQYIAIDPSSFTLSSNSTVKVANGSIATLGKLLYFSKDEDYVYGKFTIIPNKVGSTTIVVTLSDGKTVSFNLVVVCPLEELDITLEDVTFGGTVIESDIVPYKNISDTKVKVNGIDVPRQLNKLSIANSGGSGVQLLKNAIPSNAQYYLEFKFFDFTIPDGKTLQTISIDDIDVKNINWSTTSSILNTARLNNSTILEALNARVEGNVLVRIDVKAMKPDGNYTEEPAGSLFYLVNFFVPIKGITIKNGTVDVFSHDSIGDKFVGGNNVSKSVGSFSVAVNPVNSGLIPTYLQNLEIYVNGSKENISEKFVNDLVYLNADGAVTYNLSSATLKITRKLENNTYTFTVQALKSCDNSFVFAMSISEINPDKKFTAIARVIVQTAVEINEIEVINAGEDDPIYIQNLLKSEKDFTNQEEYLEYLKSILENPYELDLVYNIFAQGGKEITNKSLEFEFVWDYLADKDYYIDENGNKQFFATMVDDKLTIVRVAYDYSDYFNLSEEERATTSKEEKKKLVQFGASGTLIIYPTSNYFESTNGWNGEEPIVRIPVKVADGKSSDSAFELFESEDLKLLGESPASSFVLRNNIFMPVDYEPVENFMGKLSGRYQSEITPYGIYAIKPLFKMIAESGVVEDMFYYTAYIPELGYTFDEYVSTYNGVTYYGGLANINKGHIKNIGSNYNGTLNTKEILENTQDGIDLFGFMKIFKEHYETETDLDPLTTVKHKNVFNSSMSGELGESGEPGISIGSLFYFLSIHDESREINTNSVYGMYYGMEYKAGELVKYTGGLVGLNLGTIEATDDSLTKGYMAVGISGANVGGIAGVNEGTIKNYTFIGGVFGVESAGGIVACNKGDLKDCKYINLAPYIANVTLLILNNSAYAYSDEINFSAGGICAVSESGNIYGCVVEATYDIDQHKDLIKFLPSDSGIVYVHYIEKINESAPKDYYKSIGGETAYTGAKPSIFKDMSGDTIKAYFDDKNEKFPAEWKGLSIDEIFERMNTSARDIYVGGIAGKSKNTQISRTVVNGALPIQESKTGGFVGFLENDGNDSTNLIKDCYALIKINTEKIFFGYTAGQFISGGSLSEIKNSYVKSNFASLPLSKNGTGTPVSSFVGGTDKKTGLFDGMFAFSSFYMGGFQIPDLGTKSLKDLYNYGFAKVSLKNKTVTLERVYNEGATNEQKDTFVVSANIVGDLEQKFNFDVNRFILRGSEVYLEQIYFADTEGTLYAYPESSVTIDLSQESTVTRTIAGHSRSITKQVGEEEVEFILEKVLYYTRTVSSDGTLTLKFNVKLRETNQQTNEETLSDIKTETYTFKRTAQSSTVSKLDLCFNMYTRNSGNLSFRASYWGNSSDANYIPDIQFEQNIELDLNSEDQNETINGYFYDKNSLKYKDCPDTAYVSGYDSIVTVIDADLNHVAINDINLLYYKLFLVGIYKNLDEFLQESAWEKFSYYNPFESDAKFGPGEIEKGMIVDSLCDMFGFEGKYDPDTVSDAELKNAIKNVIEGTIIPQIKNSIADLKKDIATLKGQFNGTLGEGTGLGYQYGTKDLWLAVYQDAFRDTSDAETYLTKVATYIDVAQGIKDFDADSLSLNNIGTLFEYVDAVYNAQYQIINLLFKFMEDDDILNNIGDLTIKEGNYSKEVWLADLMRTIGPLYSDSEFMIPSALGGTESFYSEDGIPTDIQGFKNVGWDIERMYDAEGNVIESESTWVFEDGILPYLRGTKISQKVESYQIEVNPENKLDKTKLVKGTYNSDDYFLMFFNEVIGNLTNDPKAQAQLDKMNSVNLVDFIKIFNINGVGGVGNIADFAIRSSDIGVVRVVNGRLQIVGTGFATITIEPIHRSLTAKEENVIKTIKIFVTNSIGSISIYEGINADESLDGKEDVTITKDRPSYFTVANKNTVSLNHSKYNLRTNPLTIQIEISYIDRDNNKIVAYKTGEATNLFDILGLTAGNETTKFAFGTFTVITNANVLDDVKYNFNFNVGYEQGYINSLMQKEWEKELSRNEERYKDKTAEWIENERQYFINYRINIFNAVTNNKLNYGFDFNVVVRAERILVSIDKAEIDPSTVLSSDAELVSNRTGDEIIMKIVDENGKIIWISKDFGEIKIENNNKLFDASVINGIMKNGKVSAKLIISIAEDQRQLVKETKTYKVVLTDSNGDVEKTFDLVVKPQEIINVTYTHHNRTDDSSENGIRIQDQPSSILVPGDSGILSINLFPSYATYSKIVLTSTIVNGNYILMEQMYQSGDYYLPTSTTTGYDSERDVNILTIKNAGKTGNIYVRTKILDSVKEGLYFPITIQIYALDEDGNEYLAKVETITLISEVIEAANITINGEKDAVVARGTTANLKIKVGENQILASYSLSEYDSSGSSHDFSSIYFNTSEYEIENGKKIYSGTLTVGLDAEIEGDGYFKVQTIVQKIINGRLESTTDSIEVRVVDFIVEGITIDGNDERDNVFDTPSAIEKDLKFNFKLSETPEMISASQQKSIDRINKAKETFLNKVAYKYYFEGENKEKEYNYILNTDREFTAHGDPGNISYVPDQKSIAHDLFYSSDMTPYISKSGNPQTNKYFTIRYNEKNPTTLTIVGTAIGTVNMTIRIGYRLPNTKQDDFITYNFAINVQLYSDEDKPTPIENAEQFITYLQSESEQYSSTNYILMNDIVLENFVPFEKTNFANLDGNNKVITIKNFDLSAKTSTKTLNLGLFVNVLENSALKNLTVSYGELEDIIVDEKIFTSIYFGGIAVNNSGVIYNCEVVSLGLEDGKLTNGPTNGGIKIYFDASKSKHKLDTTTVQIAGLVVENNNGASITNCRVGGKGSFTKVYYDIDAGKTEQTFDFGKFDIVGQGDMSGFVIKNNGLISASYFAGASIINKTTSASLNATSGFVMYNNLGALITTSYTEGIKLTTDLSVNITGGGIESQGISAGFAYQNGGKITNCYTNIRLAGNSTGRLVSGFVYKNLIDGKLERCYSASTIVGELTTQMPFTGKNSREEIMQLAEKGLVDCYYLVKDVDTGSILEDKYGTGAQAVQISTFNETTLKTFAMTTKNDYDGVWMWNGLFPELVSANQKAISVRRIIKNYSSLISGGTSTASLDIFPYIQGYEYGSAKNPIIIRTADEFNRVFGQETTLTKNAYYAISQMYNKELGIVFGNYRLVSHIDFANLKYVENIKISSSIMALANRGNNCGSFDGNGLDIRNIEISLDGQSSVGIFSQITSGGVFKNASITVKSVSSGISGIYVGTVAGLVQNSVICNITVSPVSEDDQNRSKITGQNIVGGVVGAITGNSTISNLTSSISVVSGIKNAKKDIQEYVETILRDNLQLDSGIYVDKNKDYGFVGGIVGLLDIYESVVDETNRSSKPNAVNLKYFGQNISVQGSFVGGVVGFVGKSTYLANASFILTGTTETLNQRLISYENTIGGIVGVSFGDLFELGIEHENKLQKEIEANIKDYYSSSNQVFRGNTKLFNSTGETLEYAGGIVGQMLGGTFTTSFCGVDVAIAGAKYAGGVIGLCNTSANLFELYAFGSVDAKVAGGLIGHNLGTITLDKCTAINFYNKDNSTLSDIITAANFFNFGNVELTGYTGDGEEGSRRREFTINNNLVLKVAEKAESAWEIYGYDTNQIIDVEGYNEKIAKFELFGKTFYVTNGQGRTLLIRELISGNETYVAQYYFMNGETKVVVAKEKKDGTLADPKDKALTFDTENPTTYKFSSMEYKKDNKDDNVIATFGLNDKDNKDDNVIATFGLNDKDKIDTINLKNVSALIGSQKGTKETELGSYSILYYNIPSAKAVFANKSFTFGNFKFTLGDADGFAYSSTDDKQANKCADKLTLDLDKFQSYEQNASVVNKMFIGSYWNVGCWELREGRILPTLYFGVTSKVLYIEKPSDLLKLTRFYKLDNVLIFGDNPTTTFNPYNYKPGDSSTYGEFKASELLGLTVNATGQLIFDFSAIEKSLSVPFEGAYFPRFLGTMYAEQKGKVVLTGMNRAFFGSITGAKISDLIFDGNPGKNEIDESKSLSTAVLANTITSQAQLSNLIFKNLRIESAQSKVGVVAGEIIGVVNLGKITIDTCSVTSTSTGDLYVTEEKKDKLGNPTVEGKTDKIAYVGGIAGSFVNSTLQPAEIGNNNISKLTITTPSLKAEKDENALVYVGGLFGETGGAVVYKYNNVENITINATEVKKDTDGKDRFVYAGGYVGFAQGNTTILSDKNEYQKETGKEPGDNDIILSDLIVTTNDCDVAYVGLLFGKSIALGTNIKDWTVSIAGSINQGQDQGKDIYTAMVVGGVSGEASNVTSFAGVEVLIDGGEDETGKKLDLNLKTNTYDGIVSTVGGLFGTIVGEATIKGIKFGSNITLNSEAKLTDTKNDQVDTNSLIAVGGIIGFAQGKKLTITDVEYSGKLTLTLGEYKSYIGGIVGFIKTSTEASLTRTKFSGTIDEKTYHTHHVGGLVGCVDNSNLKVTIEQSKVSGNIEITRDDLSNEVLQVGGLVGSASWNSDSIVQQNYAWGNITIKSTYKANLNTLRVGGIIGSLNSQIGTFANNYSLTSLYVFAKASNDNVRALVGVDSEGSAKGNTAKGNTTNQATNFYCHQINLATDVFGTNLYYSRKNNNKDSILTKLKNVVIKVDETEITIMKDDVEKAVQGTKLKPTQIDSLTADLGEEYYVLTQDYSFGPISKPSAVELKGHLVGDGHTITASGEKSIFGTISGYISGVKIKFTSKQHTGTANGRVLNNDGNLPSGVANINEGIIFALSVEVSGYTGSSFELLRASFGTVQGTVVAGVVGTNNGKISDTGVVLNVKSAYAGFVGNNQGIIENCYSTGAVHNGAQYSFCNGTSAGRVYNSFTAIKQATFNNVTHGQNTVSNFFYDSDAVGITSTSTSGTGNQTSNSVCTIGDLNCSNQFNLNDSNGLVWARFDSVNFGYPTFDSNSGAYSNFEYLNIATKVDGTFYLPHVGFLKLMSGKTISKNNNYAFMSDMNMTDWKTITTNLGIINGQGYHIYGLNAVQFVGTNSGTIKNLALVYAPSLISAVIGSNNGTLERIIVSGATCKNAGLVTTNTGTITNCQNYNTVSGGENAGGIVSEMNSGKISGCRNFGSVTSSTNGNAGGIVGKVTKKDANSNPTITNCANFGDVTVPSGYTSNGTLYTVKIYKGLAGAIVGQYINDDDFNSYDKIKHVYERDEFWSSVDENGIWFDDFNKSNQEKIEITRSFKNTYLIISVKINETVVKELEYKVNESGEWKDEKENVFYMSNKPFQYSYNGCIYYGAISAKWKGLATYVSIVFFKTEQPTLKDCYNSGEITTIGYNLYDVKEYSKELNWPENEAKENVDYRKIDESTINVYTGAGLAYALHRRQNYTVNLMADVDLSKYVWSPVSGFTGTFNGNGYKIYFGSNQNLFVDDSELTTDSDAYVVGVGKYAGTKEEELYEKTFKSFSSKNFTMPKGKQATLYYDCENDGSFFWVYDEKGVWRYWFQDSKIDPDKNGELICVMLYKNNMNIFSYKGVNDVEHSVTGGPITGTYKTTVKVVNKTSVEFKNLFD